MISEDAAVIFFAEFAGKAAFLGVSNSSQKFLGSKHRVAVASSHIAVTSAVFVHEELVLRNSSSAFFVHWHFLFTRRAASTDSRLLLAVLEPIDFDVNSTVSRARWAHAEVVDVLVISEAIRISKADCLVVRVDRHFASVAIDNSAVVASAWQARSLVELVAVVASARFLANSIRLKLALHFHFEEIIVADNIWRGHLKCRASFVNGFLHNSCIVVVHVCSREACFLRVHRAVDGYFDLIRLVCAVFVAENVSIVGLQILTRITFFLSLVSIFNEHTGGIVQISVASSGVAVRATVLKLRLARRIARRTARFGHWVFRAASSNTGRLLASYVPVNSNIDDAVWLVSSTTLYIIISRVSKTVRRAKSNSIVHVIVRSFTSVARKNTAVGAGSRDAWTLMALVTFVISTCLLADTEDIFVSIFIDVLENR